MTPRRPTRLADIAEVAGVHVSTVSRILNEDPNLSVSPDTVERIMATARQLGYRPNALARALKKASAGALAMVVPLMRNPIWAELQRGAIQRAAQHGYVVLMMDEPTDDPRPPCSYEYLVEESRVDGLLLATALRSGPGQRKDLTVPHVFVNRRGPRRGNDVVMDEAGAVRLFIDHIVELGHRRVLFVDGPDGIDTIHRRVSTARRLCAARGLELTVINTPQTEQGGWDALHEALNQGIGATACGVGSLNQMFGVIAGLRAAGLRIPEDVAVVSFDEDECLSFLEAPVTSVSMPLYALGAAAVDALLDRISGAPARDVLIKAPIELLVRSSTAPCEATRMSAQ